MNAFRVIYAIARADFLERVRRYSYLITLLFAVCLGYGAGTGGISLRLGDYRGLYTSAWIGAMVALITTTFVSLVGFYIVKGAVDRDRRTGVGQILAGTPLTKVSYLLGKFLSNFAVLLSMVVVLALAAVAMQIFTAEDRTFHAGASLLPFLLLALPAMAMTAALAVFFETFRFLRGGFGNVVWFFLWTFGISLPGLMARPELDLFGVWTVYQSMVPAARAGIPGYVDSFSFGIGQKVAQVAPGFHWNGVEWTAAVVLLRVGWIAAAFALVLSGALFFDRFDLSRSRGQFRVKPKQGSLAAELEAKPAGVSVGARTAAPIHLTPLAEHAAAPAFARIFVAELRLTLKGYRWWWYAAAAGLLIGQFVAPLEVSCGPLLAAAWIWPIFIWSALGTREARYGTQQLLYSCADILPRQFSAAWLAGVAVTALLGSGAVLRLALAGQTGGVLAWAAGAVFVPSLALALGVWSGTSRFFEGLYTMLWYMGPINRVPGLDFTGAASGAQAGRISLTYFVITAIVLAAALFGRFRQLRHA
jgi:hypothetical protein